MLFQRLNRCPARVNLNLKYYLALLSEPESIIIIITKINRDRDDERHGRSRGGDPSRRTQRFGRRPSRRRGRPGHVDMINYASVVCGV